MQKLKIPFDKENGFSLRLGSNPFYFKQLQAEILLKGKVIGVSLFISNKIIAYGNLTSRRFKCKRLGVGLSSICFRVQP